MATALSAQLSAIAATSTNQLDLKAQRRAHSQSLVFDPQVATAQDFETIYEFCFEGYQELCRLEPRFTSFSKSIFSEASKTQERSQMTAAQNEELDKVLEQFLLLVGSKVLLHPAIKALEWLIRRFRIHENNTECLILTLLPYHSLPIFATLLSILPKRLPPAFKFLGPYLVELKLPPVHVVVYSATNNVAFSTAWNNYVLKSCRQRSQYSAMISYWSSVTMEAVATQLTQTAPSKMQSQKEEDVIHRILPVLSKAMALKHAPEMRIACYVIFSTLSSKVNLEGYILLNIMENVVLGITRETSHAALICLTVIAQRLHVIELPTRTFESIMAIDTLTDDLLALSERYNVSNLTTSLVLQILHQARAGKGSGHDQLILVAIQQKLVNESHAQSILENMLRLIQFLDSQECSFSAQMTPISMLILQLLASNGVKPLLSRIRNEGSLDSMVLEKIVNVETDPSSLAKPALLMEIEDHGNGTSPVDSWNDMVVNVSTEHFSFLSDSSQEDFDILAQAFSIACKQKETSDFVRIPYLHRHNLMQRPTCPSFFARYFCGPYHSNFRVTAIDCLVDTLKGAEIVSHIQILIPYLLCVLADPSPVVRRAAVGLALVLKDAFMQERGNDEWHAAKIRLYGNVDAEGIELLSPREISMFLSSILGSHLEECSLDPTHIQRVLQDALNSSKQSSMTKSTESVIRGSQKIALLKFLAEHAEKTPVYRTRLTLLRITTGLEKVGNTNRTKIFLPLLSIPHLQNEEQLRKDCLREGVTTSEYCQEIARVASPSDRESNEILENMLKPRDALPSRSFIQAILQHVRGYWSSMRSDIRQSWSVLLFDLGVLSFQTHFDMTIAKDAREILRAIQLSADDLLLLLDRLPRLVSDAESLPPNAKKRRMSEGDSSRGEQISSKETLNRLKATTQTLELVQSSVEGNSPQLLPNLFQLLQDLEKSAFSLQNDMSYTLSLLINLIRRTVEQAQKSKSTGLERGVRVDLVVECLRTTADPQVQHAALLLLSSLAGWLPEVIVHSVMPVFTLMAASVLRQNDDYSAHVVDQTIQCIIPPLIASFRKQKGGALSGAAKLIANFAAAFDHLLPHRRLELFTALTEKLGSEEYLYVLFVILQDRNGDKGVITEFIYTMMTQNSPVLQMKTIHKSLDIVMDSVQQRPKFANKIFPPDQRRNQEAHISRLFNLPCLLLKTPRLAKQVDKVFQSEIVEAVEIRESYSRMVEQLLQFLNQRSSSKTLQSSAQDLLASLLIFLSMPETLKSLDVLLEQGDDEVRCQVLKTFQKRVESAAAGDVASEKACFQLLSRLSSIAGQSEDLALKRTAIASIDLIVEKYGKKDLNKTKDIANVVVGQSCFGSDDAQIRVLALLSTTTLIEVLREAMLPLIPNVLSRSLDYLNESVTNGRFDSRLHNAVQSFFSALFLYIPWIVTGHHLDRLLELSYLSAAIGFSPETNQIRNDTLDLFAKQIDPHECFSTLQRSWSKAFECGFSACMEHLEILSKAVERSSKVTVLKESQLLVSLYLDIMDMRIVKQARTESTRITEVQMQEIETKRNQIMIKTIYKLNDTHFRPLFIKMMEWAGAARVPQQNAKLLRQSSWFSFLHAFFHSLQSIVTSYSPHIVDLAVELLNKVSPTQPESQLLWERVIKTLHASFEHDQDEFWKSPSRFAQISDPLLSQLRHAPTPSLESTLIPAITALATAADSPDHLKAINTKLLAHMGSDATAVRLAAVRTQISLTHVLGEEWLNLLPEMLPIISETMEDDDEAVEAEVRRWARQIEDVLGESLDSMLQ